VERLTRPGHVIDLISPGGAWGSPAGGGYGQRPSRSPRWPWR